MMYGLNVPVEIKKVRPNAVIPQYQSDGAAALDLHACIDEQIVIWAQDKPKLIPTGIALVPKSWHVCSVILPRGGLGTKGLVLGNTVGLVDSDYQGELMIPAWNRNEPPNCMIVKPGERIAQLLFLPVIKAVFHEVEQFTERTERGSGAFGSTGV